MQQSFIQISFLPLIHFSQNESQNATNYTETQTCQVFPENNRKKKGLNITYSKLFYSFKDTQDAHMTWYQGQFLQYRKRTA